MGKWIKKEDRVVVISGNDKGKVGKVIARKEDRLLVKGVNVRKKHMKKRTQAATSQIIETEMPIHVSNVCLCDEEGQRIHLKVRQSGGAKELYYLKDGTEVMFRQIQKQG